MQWRDNLEILPLSACVCVCVCVNNTNVHCNPTGSGQDSAPGPCEHSNKSSVTQKAKKKVNKKKECADIWSKEGRSASLFYNIT